MKYLIFFSILLNSTSGISQSVIQIQHDVSEESALLDSCYQYLHAHPELSTREIKTAAFLKKNNRQLWLRDH